MRIGLRHSAVVSPITVNNQPLKWENEISYLGIKILSAKKFTINLQQVRQKFFRALNGIFGKVGLKTSPVVLTSLIESYCVPIMLYSSESICWTKAMFNSCEHAYSLAFMKIFKTFDKNVVQQCQYFMGQMPFELKIVSKQINFLINLQNSPNNICRILSHDIDQDCASLCKLYNIDFPCHLLTKTIVKCGLWKFFTDKVFI